MSQPIQGQQSDPNANQQQSAGGTGTGTTGPTGTTGTTGSQQSGATTSDSQAGQQDQSQTELEQLRNKLSLSDRRAQQAEQALQAKEREKMDEAERTKAELGDAQTALAAQQELNKKLSLEVAFLKDNTYKWQNPSTALKVADLDGVEVGADGKVTGLKAALEKLAKSDPYLLASDNGKSSSEGEGSGQQSGQGQQGQQTGGTVTTPPMNNGNSGAGADRNSMESRFPALRGRVG